MDSTQAWVRTGLFIRQDMRSGLGASRAATFPQPFVGDEYSKEELVAQLGSVFLCAEAGIDNSQIENSAAYIQGWLKPLRNDKRLIVIASSQAARAAQYILGQTEGESLFQPI